MRLKPLTGRSTSLRQQNAFVQIARAVGFSVTADESKALANLIVFWRIRPFLRHDLGGVSTGREAYRVSPGVTVGCTPDADFMKGVAQWPR